MKILEKLNSRQKAFVNHRPVLIACIGDSVTHGCFEVFLNEERHVDTVCRAHEAYPALLAAELGKMYPFASPNIINAGVSGDNAVNGLKRLSRDALSFNPDLVIVDFGLNDSMNPDVDGGLERYEKAMRGIFESVLASGAECILLTPNYMCTYVSHNLKDETLIDIAKDASRVQNDGVLLRYVNAARKAAREMNVPVADAYDVWQKLEKAGVDVTKMLSNDINHPSKEAHGIFVRALMETIFEN